MILQRNHPSIILWGVRISGSAVMTNFMRKPMSLPAAWILPGERPASVSGKGRLQEDVYAFNDFSHNGTNVGCRPKHSVTPDMDKAYL